MTMAKFALIYAGGSMPESEADRATVMQAWGTWFGGLGAAVVDAGNPFAPAAKSISSDGRVSDGPIGTPATGYTILEAGSLDAAVAMAKACPVLQSGAQISVYEIFPAM
jgi:hypothetical protein